MSLHLKILATLSSRAAVLCVCVMVVGLPVASADEPRTNPKLLSNQVIGDRAPHNAFTDLIRFKDKFYCKFYCVYREGATHTSTDGKLRILVSEDAKKWDSAALLEDKDGDYRDAKFSITPGGKLMLIGGFKWTKPQDGYQFHTFVWFSDDGKTWTERQIIGDPDIWLWRVTWHKGICYGVGYRGKDPKLVRLYRSKDGKVFESLVEKLNAPPEYANESAIIFQPDGEAICLLRQDVVGKYASGYVGRAKEPYTEWTWKKLDQAIGGPHLLRLDDGRLLAAVRLYQPQRTSLAWLDAENGKLMECLKLSVGGDVSYAGMVIHNGKLYVSYYSGHTVKETKVYLATISIPPLR